MTQVTKKSELEAQVKTVSEQVRFSLHMIQSQFQGFEGLVVKDALSRYEPGKRHWLLVKKDCLAVGSDKVDANADSICWFCHADVTKLANNKCAGCRKVTTHLCLQILALISVCSGALL